MATKKKILLVDDEPDFAEVLGFILAEHNFSVDWAFNSDEARARIEDGSFDYVISDFFMPGLNGYELFQLVQESMETSPPFIIISGNIQGIDPEKFEGNLLAIFPKTVHYSEIVDRIHRAEKTVAASAAS